MDEKKSQAQYLSRYNVQKVQKKYEQINDEGMAWRNGIRTGEDHIYFDADHPNDPEITNMNMQAVRDGDWSGYANEDMRNAIRWNNESEHLKNTITRSIASIKEMRKAQSHQILNKAIKKGKSKLKSILSKLSKK